MTGKPVRGGHVAKFHRHAMIDLPIRSGHSARK